jgi:hypothetical protein
MRVSESKDLTVAEQPQQLITIEPAKYVELVFEPFAKRLADAKTLAAAAKFDVTTTAGMAVAVKYRATFREIRVASEKARKERKAPILEIGKLLDSRQKEIEAEIEPFESRFDAAIKAEEKRKDDEKIARALAESTRIAAISERISFLRDYVSSSFGLSAAKIAAMIETLEAEEITLKAYAERSGEAGMTKIASLEKMRDMHATQVADEEAAAEAARQAEADRIERERVAEANRIEAKRLADLAAELERQAQAAREKQAEADRIAREQREAAEREQQAANERAAAAMRQQQAEHDARMAEQRAQLEREQAALAAERRRHMEEAEAARLEQERIAREAREAAEAAAKLEADHAEALEENAAIDALRKLAAEARRQEEQRQAAEAERLRRERSDFLRTGPGDQEIIALVAKTYDVPYQAACNWIAKIEFVDFASAEEKAA